MSKIKKLISEYGQLALILHIALFVITFAMMFCVVEFGFRETIMMKLQEYFGEEYAQAGTWLVVYAATKITQPLRIVLMIFLLPILKQRWNQSADVSLESET